MTLPTPCQSVNQPTITCTPDTPGTYIITVKVTDSANNSVSASGTLTVIYPNMLLNSKFETSVPTSWSKYSYGTLPTNPYIYPEVGLTGKCAAIDFGTGNTYTGTASWIQSILSISPNTIYKLSGYMKLQNVAGNAIIEAQWKDSSGAYISTGRIANKNGTIGWTNYSGNITSPLNAAKVVILLRLRNSTGKVYFDNISFSKQ